MNNTLKLILSGNDALGKLVLRLTLGIFVLFHGVAKIFNPGSLEFIKTQPATFNPHTLFGLGCILGEVVAPLLIILGIFAHFGRLLVVGNMLFALFLVHQDELLSLNTQGGWALELQGFFLIVRLDNFLTISVDKSMDNITSSSNNNGYDLCLKYNRFGEMRFMP